MQLVAEMKQRKLIKEMYIACLEKDFDRMRELYQIEYKKIFERKLSLKEFTGRWTVLK